MLHHTSTRSDDVGGADNWPATPPSVSWSTRPTCGGTGGPRFPFRPTNRFYACGVCGAEFKEVVDAKNGVISSSKFVGDLVCFWSALTAVIWGPQKDDPQRERNAVTLSRAHDLQEHLDNVPDDVEILTVTWGPRGPSRSVFIHCRTGCAFLKPRVLSLQTLEGFRTVYLDQVTVPSLQDLTLKH